MSTINQVDDQNDTTVASLIQMINGFPIFSTHEREIVESLFDYMPRDDDIIIIGYPKTGNTWMSYIVHQILIKAEYFPTFKDMFSKLVPFSEYYGVDGIEAITSSPRVYRHHLPYNMVKRNYNSKIIYVYRKPEDCLLSYYLFTKDFKCSLCFDHYFEDFLNGKVPYGCYFEHFLSYLEHKNDENILFVSYEKLVSNVKEEILRIAQFLGKKYYNNITNNKLVVDKIIKHISFDYMKKNLTCVFPAVDYKSIIKLDELRNDIPTIKLNFFRKGLVGEGKQFLSETQYRCLKQLAKEVIMENDIIAEWFGE